MREIALPSEKYAGVSQGDHDANLINFLNVCQEEGIIVNGKKLALHKEQVSFFGTVFSKGA